MSRKNVKKQNGKGKILSRDQPDQQEAKVEKIIVPGTAVMVKELVVAPCVRTRLKWAARVAITSTSGAVTNYVLRHNGLFDVDVTGGATQPEGFDEWMSFYDRFRVVASKIKVRAGTTGSTNLNGSYFLVITPSGANVNYATIADAESAPFSIMKMYSYGGPPLVMSKYISTATLVGVAPTTVLAEQAYSGTAAADPTDPTYWSLTFQAMDAATTTSAYLFIEIEFLVDFFDRNAMAISSIDADGRPVLMRKHALKMQERKKLSDALSSPPRKELKRVNTF